MIRARAGSTPECKRYADGGGLSAARLCPGPEPSRGRLVKHENSLGNLGSCGTASRLAAIVKNRFKRIQYRPALIDGFLAQTGLSLEPEPP